VPEAINGLEVGLAVAGEGGGHRHHDRIHLGKVGVASGRVEALAYSGEHPVGHVLDVRAARAERLDDAPVRVYADNLVADLGERGGQRQPDVPEPDDADSHRGLLGQPGRGQAKVRSRLTRT
jgi:hypothetical protein